MSDNKNKQTVTPTEDISTILGDISKLLNEFRDECKVQNEQILFRLENHLTRGGTTRVKKSVVKKAVNDKKSTNGKELPKTFSNTMYWWTAMFAVEDPSVLKCATAEEIKTAEDSISNIKDKAEGYDRRRVIGLALWKGFPKSKRSGELKTMFDNWKKESAKSQAMDVEIEKNTGDDEEDEEDMETKNSE